jgi:hypothetical protein
MLHIVLFKFYDHVTPARRTEIRQSMAGLSERCGGAAAGILSWAAEWNLNRKKGYELIEIAIFADQAALDAFQAHPEHVAFAQEMREVADWVVGDLHWGPECFPTAPS